MPPKESFDQDDVYKAGFSEGSAEFALVAWTYGAIGFALGVALGLGFGLVFA